MVNNRDVLFKLVSIDLPAIFNRIVSASKVVISEVLSKLISRLNMESKVEAGTHIALLSLLKVISILFYYYVWDIGRKLDLCYIVSTPNGLIVVILVFIEEIFVSV